MLRRLEMELSRIGTRVGSSLQRRRPGPALRLATDRERADHWRVASGAALAAALGLAVLGCRSTDSFDLASPPAPGLSARRVGDCPDDSPLPQVHLLYALPSDGKDLKFDEDGVIQASVESAQGWLAKESGGSRLRFDTCQGELDVTFVRLPRSDAEYFAFGKTVRDQVEYDLWAAGYSEPNKIYAAYYGGRLPDQRCGQGPHPPGLPGNVVVLTPGAPDCQDPFPEPSPPARWEFTLVHEVFHALGAVPLGAPHEHEAGHASGHDWDLMSAPNWEFPSVLDFGRDDYWGHSDPTRADLSDSEFLEPTPAAAKPPPVWPLHRAARLPASSEPGLKSPPSSKEVKLEIINRSGRDLYVHWINHAGVRDLKEPLATDGRLELDTLEGHLWVVTDDQGTGLAIYRAPAAGWGRAVYTTP